MSKPEPYRDLIRQYLELRDAHPSILLLIRVGSFYEVLFEDAELVARELGLKLSECPSGGSCVEVTSPHPVPTLQIVRTRIVRTRTDPARTSWTDFSHPTPSQVTIICRL